MSCNSAEMRPRVFTRLAEIGSTRRRAPDMMDDTPDGLPARDEQVFTAGDVRAAARRFRIQFWEERACADCGASLLYTFDGEKVDFHPNCACTPARTPSRPASYAEVAEIFNRHPPGMRSVMWADFISSGLGEAAGDVRAHGEAFELGIERALAALDETAAHADDPRGPGGGAQTSANETRATLRTIRETIEELIGPAARTPRFPD